MAVVVSKEKLSTGFFDETEDFIDSHIDSFFPHPDQEEVEQQEKHRKEYKKQQFNPRTVEPFKPGLDKLDVETESGWTGTPGLSTREAWAEITLHVNDTAGIDRIILENKDNNEDVTLYFSDWEEEVEDGVYKFEADLDIQYWNDYVADGWDLNITLIDENGNEFVKEKHVQSKFGNFIDVLGLGRVADALAEAASAASELVKGLRNLVKNGIRSLVNNLVQPLIKGVNNYLHNLIDALYFAFLDYREDGEISSTSIKRINQAFLGPFYYSILALSTGLFGGLTALTILTAGAASLLTAVGGIISSVILQALVSNEGGGENAGLDLKPGITFDSLTSLASDISAERADEETPLGNTSSVRNTTYEDLRKAAFAFISFIGAFISLGLAGLSMYVSCRASNSEPSGILSMIMGVIFGAIGAGLAYITYDYWFKEGYANKMKALIASTLGFVVSMMGILFGTIASIRAYATGGTAGIILGVGSIGIGALAVIVSLSGRNSGGG